MCLYVAWSMYLCTYSYICSHLYINPAHSLCIRCVYHACFSATFSVFFFLLSVPTSLCHSVSYFSNVFVFFLMPFHVPCHIKYLSTFICEQQQHQKNESGVGTNKQKKFVLTRKGRKVQMYLQNEWLMLNYPTSMCVCHIICTSMLHYGKCRFYASLILHTRSPCICVQPRKKAEIVINFKKIISHNQAE